MLGSVGPFFKLLTPSPSHIHGWVWGPPRFCGFGPASKVRQRFSPLFFLSLPFSPALFGWGG